MRAVWTAMACAWLSVVSVGPALTADDLADWPYDPTFPEGYFIWRPEVVSLLDRLDPGGDCTKSGPLAFPCLIQNMTTQPAAPVGKHANPFNLDVAAEIRSTIEADLESFKEKTRQTVRIPETQQLSPGFLTHSGSRIELVGIVNRMDRQITTDRSPDPSEHGACGEVSVIYRFGYRLTAGSSRLPVTMNVIFAAIPPSKPAGASTCAEVAQRWVKEMARSRDRIAEEVVDDLTDTEGGILSLIDGHEIKRIELNMQAYRIPAVANNTDLGSTAEYIIRVFRWNAARNRFVPSFLTNEIDRARILGESPDGNSCEGASSQPISKDEFVRYITDPEILSQVDKGSLNIREEFLACRAITASPGGPHRSVNNLYWDACRDRDKTSETCLNQQLFDDDVIAQALLSARSSGETFDFIASPEDFRLRLSELSCTGCHQARAIAGFHFPGADRDGTFVANSILLPGSPHFYGDVLRRKKIIEALAAGDALSEAEMAPGYASRPLDALKDQLAHTELIGGWGAACLSESAQQNSKRKWGCKAGLECVALFESPNAPGLGACMPPEGVKQVGDYLQTGTITSSAFGDDLYCRQTPGHAWRCEPKDRLRDTRIEATLPQHPPEGNSYFGGHQEYYRGIGVGPCTAGENTEECFREKRDARSGGFPAGMLRLSECTNLPHEATCGLIATNGFTECLEAASSSGGAKGIESCFVATTSYAGLRACDAAHPCRDDYACLAPLDYNLANAQEKFEARKEAVNYSPADFGQKKPDDAWLMRNDGKGDKRGTCITSYFAFQFRSDKHPTPMSEAVAGIKGEPKELSDY